MAIGGGSLPASLVVPFGLAAVVTWASTSCLVLVGLAVLAIAAGLQGVSPTAADGRSSGLATAGSTFVVLAGAVALALTALGITALGSAALGVDPGAPKAASMVIALGTAAGLALALITVGTVRWMADGTSATTPGLLVAGGAGLLVPVPGEVARRVIGVETPPWLLFPAIVGVGLATLAAGITVRRAVDQDDSTTR